MISGTKGSPVLYYITAAAAPSVTATARQLLSFSILSGSIDAPSTSPRRQESLWAPWECSLTDGSPAERKATLRLSLTVDE